MILKTLKPEILDLETIHYPWGKEPLLYLSVSEEQLAPESGLQAPADFYVERFDLTKFLQASNSNNESPVRFGLFTSRLVVPKGWGRDVGLSLSGVDGRGETEKEDAKPDGANGGILELFIEQVSLSTADRLRVQAVGGKGLSRTDTPDTDDEGKGEDGGYGGNGGVVKILFGTPSALVTSRLVEIRVALDDDRRESWPIAYSKEIGEFARLVNNKEVKASGVEIPESMRTMKGLSATRKVLFRWTLNALIEALNGKPLHVAAALSQGVDVSAGGGGLGERGKDRKGKDGQSGEKGTWYARSKDDYESLWESGLCFAHPVQCQMLLDKAKFLYFKGSDQDKADCLDILERLQRRLAVFGTKATDHSMSLLFESYRKSADRLYTVQDADHTPSAVTRLRHIREDAATYEQQVRTQKDFYGKEPGEVPRGSFTFYQKGAKEVLEHLQEVEDVYGEYYTATNETAEKLCKVRERASICNRSIGLTNDLIEACFRDISTTVRKVEAGVDAQRRTKQKLLVAMRQVGDKIKDHFGLEVQDLIDAMGQILFCHGSYAMIGVQTAGLVDKGLTKVLNDRGIPVEKKYLLRELQEIDGTVQGLKEGFKLLKNRGIKIDDPGTEKLLMAKFQFEQLMGEFRDVIEDGHKDVLTSFDAYIDVLSTRNTAILHYNAALVLLKSYYQKIEQLSFDSQDLKREEWDKLGAGHPAMTGFLKKIYVHNIAMAQIWLYKEQQSYQFVSLEKDNVIGDTMRDCSTSQFNHAMLHELHHALGKRYDKFVQDRGQPPQEYHQLRYHLPKDDREYLKCAADEDGVRLSVDNIPLDHPGFVNKYDVRLSNVRFFADGAVTKTDRLEVMLTHNGKEIFVNQGGQQTVFTHHPVKVTFKYILSTKDHTGEDTTDGTIALDDKDDVYARVGPFARWTIEILGSANEGLQLTNVSDAYFEFDFRYYTA